MKHIRKFNEGSAKEFDKYTDKDIRLLFTDYTDENSNSLTIKDVLVKDGNVMHDTTYITDPSKYRRAKMVTLNMGVADGLSLPSMKGHCLTSFDRLEDVIHEIKRFYELSGEDEVNFHISMGWDGIVLTFLVMGGMVKQEESMADQIDGWLGRIKAALNTMGHRRVSVSGNRLDARFAKKDDYSFGIHRLLSRIGNGHTIDNAEREYNRKMVEVRNEAWEAGLKFELGGGDQQVVLKLVKR